MKMSKAESLIFLPMLPKDYPLVMLHKIVEENENEIDAKKAIRLLTKRLNIISKEIKNDDKSLLVLDYCPLCGDKLSSKKRIARHIHDIIFHFRYYSLQTK